MQELGATAVLRMMMPSIGWPTALNLLRQFPCRRPSMLQFEVSILRRQRVRPLLPLLRSLPQRLESRVRSYRRNFAHGFSASQPSSWLSLRQRREQRLRESWIPRSLNYGSCGRKVNQIHGLRTLSSCSRGSRSSISARHEAQLHIREGRPASGAPLNVNVKAHGPTLRSSADRMAKTQ